jgi:tRNA threonylcarbamoyladenosine biosynthesis protein TsaB
VTLRILAIDTSTEACSAAVLDGERSYGRFELAPRRHTELILPMVEDVLEEAGLGLRDMDALAFGRGPGAFTGLRIAAGVAQGLAFGADLPVVPVSTLQAMALGCMESGRAERIAVALDARMAEVYWGCYERPALGGMSCVVPDCVVGPESAALPAGEGWFGAGPGWAAYADLLGQRWVQGLVGSDAAVHPDARWIATLAAEACARGETVSAEAAQPVYLRDRVASRPAGPRS